MRNLIIIGGIFHPFEAAAGALSDALDEVGVTSEITDDFDGALATLAAGGVDILTNYALRWRMIQHEKYEPYRERWALEMTEKRQRVISSFVANGGALLGMHTASICFDDWPEWKDVLGGHWVWGQSSHPPEGPVSVQSTGGDHSIARGVEAFTCVDEIYQRLDLRDDITPLMEARVDGEDDWHLVAWAHQYGKGRVVCDLLGHDAGSINEPAHRRFLQRSALWALDKLEKADAA